MTFETMLPGGPVHWGVILTRERGKESATARPDKDWQAVRNWALHAERTGFHGIWILDHFQWPPADHHGVLETWTTLAALSQATTGVMLGTLGSSAAERPAALTVSMAQDLQAITGGRFCLGIGSASGSTPHPGSASTVAGQSGQFESLLRTCRLAWPGPDPGQLAEAGQTRPDPAGRPLVLLGVTAENTTLPAAAAHADIVNWQLGVRQFTRSSRLLARLCEAADRDPASVRRTHAARFQLFDSAREFTHWCQDELRGLSSAQVSARIHSRGALCGTASMIEDTVAGYLEAGCAGFLISCDAGVIPEALDALSSLRPGQRHHPHPCSQAS
jgi:alkanesulfonate monooxygenase SsuD/methylene tetrahydromethanopterin reductase-like flavin-dependent oxidoreductase (luciferase family)